MRVTLDEEADAAYIYFVDESLKPLTTVPVEGILPWMINLDFDADGRMVGIEVLDARRLLPGEFLARFANREAIPSE
jgi:uncharacterized protein YuzE